MNSNQTSEQVGVGGTENINFRPSPNFINMKFKIQKSRKDDEHTINQSVEECRKEPDEMQQREPKPKITIQPPLPLEEPPPDNPLQANIKQEVIDPDYPDYEEHTNLIKTQDPVAKIKTDTILGPGKKNNQVCKDYLRNKCFRPPGTCRFKHTHDIIQLLKEGHYKFCKDFQNSICTYAVCRHVHADQFQEGQFRREDYLPPHILNQFAENLRKLERQPPPPPPMEASLPLPAPMCMDFSQPPPTFFMQTDTIEANKDYYMRCENVKPQLRHDWNTDGYPAAYQNEPVIKKCVECENKDFLLQYNKDKVSNMIHSLEKLKKSSQIMAEKQERLNRTLLMLCNANPTRHASTDSMSGMMYNPGMNTYQNVQSHTPGYYSTPSESSLNNFTSGISNLIAEYLQNDDEKSYFSNQ